MLLFRGTNAPAAAVFLPRNLSLRGESASVILCRPPEPTRRRTRGDFRRWFALRRRSHSAFRGRLCFSAFVRADGRCGTFLFLLRRELFNRFDAAVVGCDDLGKKLREQAGDRTERIDRAAGRRSFNSRRSRRLRRCKSCGALLRRNRLWPRRRGCSPAPCRDGRFFCRSASVWPERR